MGEIVHLIHKPVDELSQEKLTPPGGAITNLPACMTALPEEPVNGNELATNAIVVFPKNGLLGEPYVAYVWISQEAMERFTYETRLAVERWFHVLGPFIFTCPEKARFGLAVFLLPSFGHTEAREAAEKLGELLRHLPNLGLRSLFQGQCSEDIERYLSSM